MIQLVHRLLHDSLLLLQKSILERDIRVLLVFLGMLYFVDTISAPLSWHNSKCTLLNLFSFLCGKKIFVHFLWENKVLLHSLPFKTLNQVLKKILLEKYSSSGLFKVLFTLLNKRRIILSTIFRELGFYLKL